VVNSACTFENDLHVIGNLSFGTISNVPSPFWCAGKVNGSTLAVTARKGAKPDFVVSRLSGYDTGVFRVSFAEAHPDGSQYVIQLSVEGMGNPTIKVLDFNPPTANDFHVVLNEGGGLRNDLWYFSVLR
jgi:hypothetical protein